MSSQVKNKIYYLEALKVLSCILVVLVHSAANSDFNSLSPRSIDWLILSFYNSLGRVSIVLFVMISGALALNPNKNFSFSKAIKIFYYYVSIYYICLFSYNLLSFIMHSTLLSYTFSNIYSHVIGNTLATNGMYHLWYLPMIGFLFLLTPILKK